MISQIAIATNGNGVIGSDDGLLVHCKADMRRFADFTAMTAMICGTKTAQEMLDAKIKLSFSRPMIVIGKTPMVCSSENAPFLFMVESLKDALMLAESLTRDMNISGYTICGGAQLYSDVLASKTITFDRAYVAVFDYQPSGLINPKTVACDAEDLIRAICNKMSGAFFEREVTAQVSTVKPGDQLLVSFIYINSLNFREDCVRVVDGVLILDECDAGTHRVTCSMITGYVLHRLRNSVTIVTNNGRELDIRFAVDQPEPRMAALTHYLNIIISDNARKAK